MSRADKREQRIRGSTRNVPLEDFEWLISQYGYIRTGSGSHGVAVVGEVSYAYPRTNPMRQPYVKRLLEIIDVYRNR